MTLERPSKKEKRIDEKIDEYRIKIKDSEDLKLRGEVFDTATLKALYTFANKGIIKAMGGVVSTGKEGNVFHAIGAEDREIAIKIYRIATSDFRKMEDYMLGDPRFANIKHTQKGIIFAWTQKEFRNLQRAAEAGVRVPAPIEADRNILIMEFIGKDGIPAPRLRDVQLAEPEHIYRTIVSYMVALYQEAKLVHSDLSEFNILLYEDEPVIIDMGQSVLLDHPMSREFLQRDVKNIVRYFKKLGVKCDEDSLLTEITTKK
ncbi:serine protein kinase RIO [Methanocella arvoryzae]|uniref:non-specific serine/threonine protein kinase n=1 Tax=Methanocella arvoryzae (strain DSM 22066 / NBRC 105507 / MRE50) TaxID=351160 RepID=Q0W8M8_METAR|nr:serine/threonine protein kinase [uncultured archaeon]CAJ35265.1 putative serine/threonine protein kinase [Methanocella arvoryzae MRE50]